MATKTASKKAPAKAPKAAAKAAPKAQKAPKAEASGLFAVFATGGKQYRVSVGDRLKIEKMIHADPKTLYKEGDVLVFNEVLLVDDGASETTIGTPFIVGAKVSATITSIGRYAKIDVIKYKQKSRYFKKNGHRQPYFEVQIDSIK